MLALHERNAGWLVEQLAAGSILNPIVFGLGLLVNSFAVFTLHCYTSVLFLWFEHSSELSTFAIRR